MKTSEIQIEVYGRVQGVNFRAMTKSFADELGLNGYVMNRDDGSVLITVQGDKIKLERFLEWMENSPGLSKITHLEHKWKRPSIEYKEFSIARDRGFVADRAKSLVNLGKSFITADVGKIPVHISIIPDGNRRWAKEK